MVDTQKAAQGSAAPAKTSLPFKQMSPNQKFVFILKLTVCVVTFGLVFPNVMSD